jgi:hypothetical protein
MNLMGVKASLDFAQGEPVQHREDISGNFAMHVGWRATPYIFKALVAGSVETPLVIAYKVYASASFDEVFSFWKNTLLEKMACFRLVLSCVFADISLDFVTCSAKLTTWSPEFAT